MVLIARPLAGAWLVLAASCAPPVSVPSPDAPTIPDEHAPRAEVIRAFRDASNAHDVTAVAEILAPDVVWHRGAAPELVGREAVLAPIAFDAATNATFEIGALSFDGTTVRCVLVEANDFYRALGLDAVEQVAEFEIDGERITAITSLPSSEPSSEPTEEQLRVARFLAWLAREHPEDAELVQRAPGPRPEDAARIVARACEWAESQRAESR